jgi:Fe-S cluster assembly protein SufB
MTIYNQAAILRILSYQTKEGQFLLNGVLVQDPSGNKLEDLPSGFGNFAYKAGLIGNKSDDIIKCNTRKENGATLERITYTGKGGIYNFVTKRGLCLGKNSKISWTQVETGSAITWKYPSCILIGENSKGEFYSVALTNNFQQADTGTKMFHIGKKTKSRIIAKGISAGNSKNSYRGLVKISQRALYSRNYSQCDSLLIGHQSIANTFPYIQVQNNNSKIEHEASTSKIAEDQIFYFLQRGISLEKTISLIINGFCQDVFNQLPLEFAAEADRLLSLKLEGTVG